MCIVVHYFIHWWCEDRQYLLFIPEHERLLCVVHLLHIALETYVADDRNSGDVVSCALHPLASIHRDRGSTSLPSGHRQAANKWRYSVRGEGIYYSYLKDDRWMQREQSSASIMHLLASYLITSHLASAVVRPPPILAICQRI